MDLKCTERIIISAKIFFINHSFMRESNYYALPDAARQADVTPNSRCMKAAFNY